MLPLPPNTYNLGSGIQFAFSPIPWQHIYRRFLHRISPRIQDSHWALLGSVLDKIDPLQFDPRSLQLVPAPDSTTYADPFIWNHNGNNHVFIEEWRPGEPHAHLSTFQLNGIGAPIGTPQPIIQGPHHLSYPNIYEYDDCLWMLPEQSASGKLQPYRCESFPHQWTLQPPWLEGVRYADPTLLQHNDKWWLFITLGKGLHRINSDLFLYHTDNPLTENWTSHPQNPVARGFHLSRPAGKPFMHNGKLYRPAQNCLRRYGHGLKIMEIQRIDTKNYQERTVREIKPWHEDILGIHHLSIDNDVLMVDLHLKGTRHSSNPVWLANINNSTNHKFS